MISTGPFVDSNFSPSCSCIAVKLDGPEDSGEGALSVAGLPDRPGSPSLGAVVLRPSTPLFGIAFIQHWQKFYRGVVSEYTACPTSVISQLSNL